MPEEVKQEVNTEASSTSETTAVNNESVPAEQTQEVTTQETNANPPAAGQQSPNLSLVDERGVPWQNTASEWKRKFEELTDKMPNLVDESIKSAFQQYGGKAQQEPTIQDLEMYKLENANNPQAIAWAEAKKEEIRNKTLDTKIKSMLDSSKQEQVNTVKKQQSLNYVMTNYPDAFIKDQQGNILDWNHQHPLSRQIAQLMQDKRLANDPEGLAVAADIAYARYSRSMIGKTQQKEQALKDEVNHLKKQTLVEGGNRNAPPAKPDHQIALEKLKSSGRTDDAVAALKAISKARLAAMGK